MREERLDALVLTTPPNVRYFTGFASQFWESPTRPWFVIVPAEGPLTTAVVPEIGAPAFAALGVERVLSWPAPQPEDDGVSLLAGALRDLPRRFGRIGWEMGRESVVRMPLVDLERVRQQAAGIEMVDGSPLLWALRRVKSDAEVARIRFACRAVSDAFEALPEHVGEGDTEWDVSRSMRRLMLERGVDTTPFVAVISGHGGYGQIIAGPSDRRLARGDVLFLDTGATYDGYFCDFDRNIALGPLDDAALRAQEVVWQATEAGIAAARPGATTSDVWRAMARSLEPHSEQPLNVGRMGHGLGLQLTEPPSNMPGDDTLLEPGVVLTIEPGLAFGDGRMLVHEENLVVTGDGNELLTRRAPREMWRAGG
jgi:Xaa-Pro aminopeptidase